MPSRSSDGLSYLDWIERHTRRRTSRADELDREEPAAPSEPLELKNNSTLTERIRDAIRNRFREP